MAAIDILSFLDEEKKKSVRIARNFWVKQKEVMADLGVPMRVMLKELTTYGLRGGKWHRPALVRLVIRLLGKNLTPAGARASVATELMHRYILVHDDILDLDLERHGGPTLQKVYQNRFSYKFGGEDITYSLGMAMIGGDVINSLLHLMIAESGLKTEMGLSMIRGINQDFIETGAGWFLETDLKNTPLIKVSMKQVKQAMLLVSAQYSVLWPLRLGEILAGREYGDWLPVLEDYGTKVGMGFQLQDDILGIFGKQQETGKPVGNDLREGKKTLLTQFAFDHAKPAERKYLQQSLNREIDFERLNKVREIMESTGAYNYAKIQAAEYVQGGINAVKNLKGGDEEAKEILIALAEFLANRKN